MVKSRAEIQKAYRQRLKERNNEQYLAKERLRRRANYVPNNQLSRSERAKRNKQNRDYLKVYRERKRVPHAVQENVDGNDDATSTSGYESTSSVPVVQPDDPRRLVVQMAFPNRARGSRVRIQNALEEYKREMKVWKGKYENLTRKYKTKLRAMQRLRKRIPTRLTPKSKTDNQIKDLGLNQHQAKTVRKQLLFSNVLCEEIGKSRQTVSRNQRSIVHNLIGGKILKKYQCIQMASKATGLSRNKLGLTVTKSAIQEKIRRRREFLKNKDKVISFMERDDNSRMMPGKADYTKEHGEKKQKKVLSDYLANLHQKFLSENPGLKLSLATFCRIRPAFISLASFISRSTCLCTKHQNMTLTLKSARNENIQVSVNGDHMLNTKDDFIKDLKEKVTNNEVVLNQWKRVPIEDRGKQKMVMKIIEQKMTKEAFVAHTQAQVEEFAEHVNRVKTQYGEIKRLKENLPENNIIVQMDFAENYSCKALNEIQSAYWNQTHVTLHPFVLYFRQNGSSELKHKSYVIISDELAHNSNTVLTFLGAILKEVRNINPNVSVVHYWSDSPTSQYRNKFIFHEIANHKEFHNIDAKWNYFEAGHGKGPCDGVGGITKRMADEAVNTNKAAIQSAADFFAWSQSAVCNLNNVHFIFIPKEACETKALELAKRSFKAVSGTMKVHAVAGHGNSEVSVRDTSCYCNLCLSGTFTCDTWRKENVGKTKPILQEVAMPVDTEGVFEESGSSDQPAFIKPNINDYVAARYNDKWYIGKVIDVDDDDNEAEISFMETKKSLYQWPRQQDVIWIKWSDLIKVLKEPPVPTGKTMRLFSISKEDKSAIDQLFNP